MESWMINLKNVKSYFIFYLATRVKNQIHYHLNDGEVQT